MSGDRGIEFVCLVPKIRLRTTFDVILHLIASAMIDVVSPVK